MQIKFSNTNQYMADSLVMIVGENLTLSDQMKKIDNAIDKKITNAINSGIFLGKKGEYFYIFGNHNDLPKSIVLMGYGKKTDLEEYKMIYLGGKVLTHLNDLKLKSAQIILNDEFVSDVSCLIAQGIMLKNYKFNKYHVKRKIDDKSYLHSVDFIVNNPKETENKFLGMYASVEGIYLARDLICEPPNIIYPESIANKAKELEKLGVIVEILGEKEMHELGMGAILGVGQGSAKESKIVVMKYLGKESEEIDIAIAGKGVTFDTGGISIKPAQGMEDMKYDMAGSAIVIGLIHTLSTRKAKVNVIGVIGLAENMPGGNAQRPSDVVTSMSGQTIEVVNTDAEGRLVLADVLWYVQDRFNPSYIIDLATLTGAITTTFGAIYAGLFSNDDELADKLLKAGIKTDEKLWRLPISEVYDKMINSEIADMQNMSNEKGAGSIIGAQFLHRFVNNTPWAHLDIAGVTWTKKDIDSAPKGPTGYGIRLLNQFIMDSFEK